MSLIQSHAHDDAYMVENGACIRCQILASGSLYWAILILCNTFTHLKLLHTQHASIKSSVKLSKQQ